jgi:hypothetical protein
MMDLMGTITCNGDRAFDLTELIGEGLSFNLYAAWMDAYLSSNIQLSYFENPSATAISDLEACTPTLPLPLCLPPCTHVQVCTFFQTPWTLVPSPPRSLLPSALRCLT